MKRILVRSGKNAFDVISPAQTLESDVIGGNSGNLIFAAASQKLLSAEGVEVTSTQNRIDPTDAPKINDEYDAFVVPLANAFRPSFESGLVKLTRLIDKLTIPVVMLSGGAQLDIGGGFGHLKPMEESVSNFCKAVLARSSKITVRGEYTQEYLHSLGFRDVEVIGCPSLTTKGPHHRVNKRFDRLSLDSRIAYSVQSSNSAYAALIERSQQRYRNLTYVAQDKSSLEMMLWSREVFGKDRDRRLPFSLAHRVYERGSGRFYVDAPTWISAMKSYEFSFGPRIHGNIAPILAGTPAVVVAHDSRTLELAKYHSIPYILEAELNSETDLQDIFERADFSAFNSGQQARFNKVVSFLHENGFRTIYDKGQEAQLAAYEQRLESIEFPEAVVPLSSALTPEEKYRIGWLRQRMILSERKINGLEKSVRELQGRVG